MALLPLFFTSCSERSSIDPTITIEEAQNDFHIAQTIKGKINDDLAKDGFFLTTTHGDYHPKINLICDDYSTILYQYEDVEKVRELIYSVVKKYLVAFNNDATIKPILHNYPLTEENLQISIFFYDNEHQTLSAPYISSVACKNGVIRYYVLNDDEVPTEIAQEPFDAQDNDKEECSVEIIEY